jgi:ABC-type polysaccharide/polyol phosphate export permease
VTHLVGLVILLVVLVFADLVGWTFVYVPLYLFLLLVPSLGLGWFCAALQVFLRDTLQVLSVIMVLWFWFTPIFYSVEMVPQTLQALVRSNPLTYVVNGYRHSLLEHRPPEPAELSILVLFSLLAFIGGGYVFRKTKREFVDVL